MTNHQIQTKNLYFSYPDRQVLCNLNIAFDKGDFVGLVGSNGTGKSTLIKLFLNIVKGYTGELYLQGTNVQDLRDYKKIGYVSQKSNSFNSSFPATVKEVILANYTGKKDKNKKLKEVLNTVEIDDLANKLIGNLSGGQQQKVFIARTLINDPDILFLDEPTVGIDASSVISIIKVLTKLNRENGITILMTTHDLPSIQDVINKILFLDENGHSTIYDAKNLSEEDLCNIFGHPYPLHKDIKHTHQIQHNHIHNH